MASKAIIIGKNEGKTIPDAYLTKVIAEVGADAESKMHTAIGVAFAKNDIVEQYKAVATPTLESVKEVMANFEQQTVFLFLRSTSEILEDDLQPYSLIENDKGQPTLVAFIEGTFPNYEQGDNAHMPEHFVINDYLMEKLGEIYETENGNLEKVLKALDAPTFRKDLRNLFIPRGVITLVAANGAITTFAKNELAGSYPWGWTSNKLDYVETASKEEKKAASTSLLDKLKGSAVATSVPSTPKTDTKVPAGAGEERIAVPPNMHGKARKKWMNRNLISRPENWESLKEVPASLLRPGSAMRMSLKSFKELSKEDMEAAKAEAAERRTEQSLLIPPNQRKVLLDRFITQLKEDSTELITKEKIDQLEDEYPTFTEQAEDYPLQLALHWPVARLEALAKECGIPALVSYANEVRHELLKAKPELLREEVKKPAESPSRKRM